MFLFLIRLLFYVKKWAASLESYREVELQKDAHVIAGTLLQILKEMVPSLFHEVYEDFLIIEMTEDITYNKRVILDSIHVNYLIYLIYLVYLLT